MMRILIPGIGLGLLFALVALSIALMLRGVDE